MWDSETTDLDYARFVEVAAIDQDGNVLFDQRINPHAEIAAGATNVHGITRGMVAECPTFREVFLELRNVLHQRRWVIYNVAFDAKVMVAELKNLFGGENDWAQIKGKPHCAMEMYAQFYGEYSSYWGNFKWKKLTLACEEFGIEVNEPAHSALGDCRRTLAVIHAMARWLDRQEQL